MIRGSLGGLVGSRSFDVFCEGDDTALLWLRLDSAHPEVTRRRDRILPAHPLFHEQACGDRPCPPETCLTMHEHAMVLIELSLDQRRETMNLVRGGRGEVLDRLVREGQTTRFDGFATLLDGLSQHLQLERFLEADDVLNASFLDGLEVLRERERAAARGAREREQREVRVKPGQQHHSPTSLHEMQPSPLEYVISEGHEQ